jgi:hypothetical protein
MFTGLKDDAVSICAVGGGFDQLEGTNHCFCVAFRCEDARKFCRNWGLDQFPTQALKHKNSRITGICKFYSRVESHLSLAERVMDAQELMPASKIINPTINNVISWRFASLLKNALFEGSSPKYR